MNKKVEKILIKIIKDKFDLEINDLKLRDVPKNMFGDISFNGGILARDLKKNPNIIVEELKKSLEEYDNEMIDGIELAGAYLNIKVNNNNFTDIFNDLFKNKNNLVKNIGNNKNIVIDYIGANVGKPMHIGHMCTPNQGQVMINIYKKLGYNVISDSHIGDWGIIFGKLIMAYKLWGDENKLKENAVDYLLELYIKITTEVEEIGDELEQKIREEFKLLSEGNTESVELWREFTKYSIGAMNKQLARLNIKPDYNIGESFYEGLGLPKMENYPDLEFDMHSVVNELIKKDIATKNEDNSVGVIFDDKFKLSSCILQKRDGTHGYLASDLAAIKYRVQNWNPEKIVYFVDSRQVLHLRQVFTITKDAGWLKDTELFHAANGFISLKDGAMSTRKGRIIKLDKLLDEAEERAKKIILEKRDDIIGEELNDLSKIIGIGAIKYGYLKKNRETDVIFDWDEFMTFEGNSGPYIQYAYVRALRILEKSGGNFEKISGGNFKEKEEIELIKKLSEYNDILLEVTKNNTPHILCKYSYELTKIFNTFYNNVHILNEEDDNKKAIKLQLVELFSIILKDSFTLLGIEMPEKM